MGVKEVTKSFLSGEEHFYDINALLLVVFGEFEAKLLYFYVFYAKWPINGVLESKILAKVVVFATDLPVYTKEVGIQ